MALIFTGAVRLGNVERAMFDRLGSLVLAVFMLLHVGAPAIAEDAAWRVGKSSGDVSITSSGVQPAALTAETTLKPGDAIRTGRNGRALLLRGEESILIEPNSVIGIPAEKKEGLSTTILQRAGSILLEVEKRNVQHFEVETPYLAALVKGTRFRVTVDKRGARVDVLRGQVEVSDFKSGKFVLVLPGQAAAVSVHGGGGLTLSGSGLLNPIRSGTPRTPSVTPVLMPGNDLPPMRSISNGSPLRIAAPLGEVDLDINKATQGLARGSSQDNPANRSESNSGAGAGSADGAYAMGGNSGLGGVSGASGGGGFSSGGGVSAGGGVSGGGAVSGGAAVSGGGSSSGGLLSGVLGTVNRTVGGVTSKLKLSDIRLKRDIVPVGRLANGLGLYRYRYLWSDTAYVGVMAQEVALVRSDAVVRGADGYLRVDYDALGLRFQTSDEWNASSQAIAGWR